MCIPINELDSFQHKANQLADCLSIRNILIFPLVGFKDLD